MKNLRKLTFVKLLRIIVEIGNIDLGKSVKDSDYHNLKRKYDDLQIKQNEYEKERAEKKGWCIIM